MTGTDRIQSVFSTAKSQHRAVFMPYHAMGYPDRATTLEIMRVLGEAGAEWFEIGIPHSDPLADGPTIQTATYTALTQGTTVQDCLAMCRAARRRHDPTLLRHDLLQSTLCLRRRALCAGRPGRRHRRADRARPAAGRGRGVGGCLPRDGLATIYLLAPTSTDERIRIVAQHATGFIYLVSVTGITGARMELPPDLAEFVARVRGTPTSRWPWALASAAAPRRPPSPRLPTG